MPRVRRSTALFSRHPRFSAILNNSVVGILPHLRSNGHSRYHENPGVPCRMFTILSSNFARFGPIVAGSNHEIHRFFTHQVSPAFYAWSKHLLLRYRYSSEAAHPISLNANTMPTTSLAGISLYTPRIEEVRVCHFLFPHQWFLFLFVAL